MGEGRGKRAVKDVRRASADLDGHPRRGRSLPVGSRCSRGTGFGRVEARRQAAAEAVTVAVAVVPADSEPGQLRLI